MYRVLVPIDTSEARAASQARTVAALPGAPEDVEATLFHVFDDRQTAETTTVRQLPAGKRATEILVEAGLPVTAESGTGEPAEAIVGAAERIDADHIVMGGRKRGRMESLLFGSVSRSVARGTDLPVTIAGDATQGLSTYVCGTCGERVFTEEPTETCPACGADQLLPPAT
jgi:nucleotide-binding universal stress UspA family protein